MADTTRINPTPAQTWNRLSINDVAVDLPEVTGAASAPATDVAGIEMGMGEVATAWLDDAAANRIREEIAAGQERTVIVDANAPVAADVVVAEGAHVRIVLSASPTEGVSGCVLRVMAAERSSVELVSASSTYAEATLLLDVGIRLGEDACADVRQFALGAGGTTVMGLACDQVGRASSYAQTLRYLVHDGERLDMNYVARMRGEVSRAGLTFSGVLEDGGHKRLADTIDLIHGCKGAKGAEDETVLVTGEHVENLALPSVLCDEDDVEGTHGATIGAISPEQLGYLADHGLTEADAQGLFVRAIFDDALTSVPEAAELVLAVAHDALGPEVTSELRESASLS